MRTLHIVSAAVLSTFMLMSCHNDEIVDGGSTSLKIMPTIEKAETRAGSTDGFTAKRNWETGDEMGLFMYNQAGWGEPYLHFVVQNLRSVYQDNKKWVFDNPVYLNSEKGIVWSYSPYSTEATDGTAIPVHIRPGESVDYMWGKSENLVSAFETDARIPMNHALSQFVLRLKISPSYKKDGKLTSVKLMTAEPKFAVDGTMDLSQDGKISFEPTLKELDWVPGTNPKGDLDYAALVYPMTLAKDEVTLQIALDGDTWTFRLPATTWMPGKRHIYTVQAKFNDLTLGNEDGNPVDIRPWEDSNIDIGLEGN